MSSPSRGGSLKFSPISFRRYFLFYLSSLAPKRRLFVPALTFANITVRHITIQLYIYVYAHTYAFGYRYRKVTYFRAMEISQSKLYRVRREFRDFRLLSSRCAKARSIMLKVDYRKTAETRKRDTNNRGENIDIYVARENVHV